MATRRIFLKSVPLMAVTSVVPANSAEQDSPEYLIGKLALALKTMHGGEWSVNINHKSKVAIVVQL